MSEIRRDCKAFYGPEGYWSDLLDHAPVAFIECFTQQLAKGGQKASHT